MQRLFRLMVGRTARNSAITVGSNVIYGLAIIAFTIIISRRLGPEQFGLFSVAIAVFGLSFDILSLGTSQSLVRFVSVHLGKQQVHTAHQYARAVLILRFFQAIFLMFMALILAKFVAIPVMLAVAAAGGILLLDFFINLLQAYEKFFVSALVSLLNAAFKILALFLVIAGGSLSVTSGVTAFIISPWLASIVGFLLAPKTYLAVSLSPKILSQLLQFSKWMALWGATAAVVGKIDVLLISKLTSIYETGIYAAASRLATGYILIGSAYAAVLTPKISRLIHDRTNLQRQIKLIALSIGGIMIGIMGLAYISPWVVPLLFGPEYIPSIAIFKSLSFASVFFVSSIPANVSLLSLGHSKFIGILALIQLLVLISGSFVFIPVLGAHGAALALGAAYLSTFIIASSYAYKKIYS